MPSAICKGTKNEIIRLETIIEDRPRYCQQRKGDHATGAHVLGVALASTGKANTGEAITMTPRRIYDPLTGQQITADDFAKEIRLLQRHIDAARDERTEEIYRQVLAKRKQELAELSS